MEWKVGSESMLSFCHEFISKVLYSEHILKLKTMNSEVKLTVSTDGLRKPRHYDQWRHILIMLKMWSPFPYTFSAFAEYMS